MENNIFRGDRQKQKHLLSQMLLSDNGTLSDFKDVIGKHN